MQTNYENIYTFHSIEKTRRLQASVNALKKSNTKLEKVIDTIKEERKHSKSKLWTKIDILQKENRKLKTKVQNNVARTRDWKEELQYQISANEKQEYTIAVMTKERDHFQTLRQSDKSVIEKQNERIQELEDAIKIISKPQQSDTTSHSRGYQQRRPYRRGRPRDYHRN